MPFENVAIALSEQNKKEALLNYYDALFSDKEVLSLDDLKELKKKGISTEEFLTFLVSKNNFLLHGSRNKVDIKEGLKENNGEIYATNNPSIAILKSLFSNKKCVLNYPNYITQDNPLILEIENPNETTIGETGYVYLVEKDDEFINEPKGSWQYIKKNKPYQKILKIIETEETDFTYETKIKK